MFRAGLMCCVAFLGVGLHSSPPAADAPQRRALFLVVRHADRQGSDDALTDAGHQRAKLLRDFAVRQDVTAVYSTDTRRTRDTAAPTAAAIGADIKLYERQENGKFDPMPSPGWLRQLAQEHAGQTVLIVGHSNTVVPIVRGLGGRLEYTVGHNEYDSMFLVSVAADTADVVRIKFGPRTPGEADTKTPLPKPGSNQNP